MSLSLHKYGLALHTSSPELGLAISNFQDDYRSQTYNLARDISTQLHWLLKEFIQPQTWQDLAFLAVAKGPGSFTGTRIGIVTARTLAQQLDIPLFAISTLAALAYEQTEQYPAQFEDKDIAIQMLAQRGQIFAGIYQCPNPSKLLTLLPDNTYSLSQWQQTLEKWPNPYHLVFAEASTGGSVSSLLHLAHSQWQQGHSPHWAEALPFYGQHPVG